MKSKKLKFVLPVMIILLLIVAYIGYGKYQVYKYGAQIHFIDVGQGDSILFTSRNATVLIDGGESNQAFSYLVAKGIRQIDYLVITHPHADHIGGLPQIINTIPVDTIIMPDVVHTTKSFENLIEAIENSSHNFKGKEITVLKGEQGFTFEAGNALFTVLWPSPIGEANFNENLNNASIVLKAEVGGTGFLFTGDAESWAEDEMLKSPWGLEADVLKIGHHGSNSSSTEAFLSAVDPDIAVISCGIKNAYGHPHKEVLDRLYEKDITVLRTDELGHILLQTNGKNRIKRR